MSCVICLNSVDAERVCCCSALACRCCLLALLDHGRERCAVCGSRFQPAAVVRACLFGLAGPADGSDPAKVYVKLAMAYLAAEEPRRALRSLAIAQHLVVPGSCWDHMISLETAESLLAIGHIASAEGCLRSVMPRLLESQTRSSGVLFANCCTLLCKTNMLQENFGPARAWLRRALNIQADLELDGPLATSLQLDAKLLGLDGKHLVAKKTLQSAEHILSRTETDECLKGSVQVEIAKAEIQLGETDLARARLSVLLPTLRRRMLDKFSAALLPVASFVLSGILSPSRRLRRKTWPELVGHREAASPPAA